MLPAWLNEGLAEWVEARSAGKRTLSEGQWQFLVANRERLFSLADLSGPAFGRFGPDAARVAYLQSYAFIDFLVRTTSERDLRRLGKELVRTGNLPRSIERVFRRDLAVLEQRFLRELQAG